jgi:selenocysteine lyase/cysteine desulfurase
MNFYDPGGLLLDYRRIEELAGRDGLSLRTGCFCNPGGAETAFGITAEEVNACFRQAGPLTHDSLARCIDGKPTGAVRVSLGLASNFADVERFLEFARGLREAGSTT